MHLRELFPFDPVLKFARPVSGIRPGLKHRHDHDLGPDRLGRHRRNHGKQREQKQTQEEIHPPSKASREPRANWFLLL
jgi:hypothetical protein